METPVMHQPGFFDFQNRVDDLNAAGNPLVELNRLIDWERFRPTLGLVREKERKNNSGRKPFDVVLMFKIVILQSLYNLSDARIEFQIRDRISFMSFLGLSLGDRVPDEKTVWLFREQLTKLGLIEVLFAEFDDVLAESGFHAQKGQILDASIIPARKQQNSREENKQIKSGETPAAWSKQAAKTRQKDTDARWTKKRNKSYFGYKNHVGVDVKHKFIRTYSVTDASVHDSQVMDDLLDDSNTSADVYADSAYRSAEINQKLEEQGYRDRTQHRAYRNTPLTDRQKATNRRRSSLRSRVEHVFGVQSQMAGSLLIRTVGLVRATAKIGLRNLAYNIKRYTVLARAAS
jgi:IS5 family transposase